ncbi:class I SAM-dependent methyltransferase [Catenovulum sp. 2E275]|uniref:class I SAM-dependent rRNA methyltransferase n=1 Tax=Catenovulum sp. 2E275 TaxID=2980497 RepID=UPI0021D3AAF6|nr:class I SAM-dependent methyltransferase [Catenovulum sp. 2E275]MCU4674618.1 class I SAM-dependent methyltransferase [Catenovulum sp. 2E275]
MSHITLVKGREKSLLRKHPWIFSRAIAELNGKPKSGETIDVYSAKGEWLAKAAYSPQSQIRARVWSFEQTETIDFDFFVRKIKAAKAMREQLISSVSNAYRLIAGESDGIPGLTLDLYNNVIVGQFLSAGVEFHKQTIVKALNQVFPDMAIYERSDVAVRKKEGLSQTTGWLSGQADSKVWITENGLKILVDIEQGHKTGFYLDQRDNRQIAAQYCQNKQVLNCFSYTGTFGLYALQAGADKVTNVDVSDTALNTASLQYAENGFNDKFEQVNADVFKLLRQYKEQDIQFDVIVLDPPKFAENKGQVIRACRGYKDINMLALQLLKPGGTLLTFSCSGLVDADLFQKVVADAAVDAGVNAQIIQKLTQAKDHPISLNYPEAFYLKGLVVKKAV